MSLEELEDYARQFDRGEDIKVYDFSKIGFGGHFFQSLPAAIISNELAKRRQKFYNSRKSKPTQSKPRRASPVNQDPDSLFLANGKEDEECAAHPARPS
jgi:hypothetical protein